MARQPYTLLAHRGEAVEVKLAVDATATDLTFTLDGAVGWPDGSDGPFLITVDPDGTEEKVMVTSRTGNTLTVAALSDRGLDGSAPATHDTGVTVRHCFTAIEADEANAVAVQVLGQITGPGDLLAGVDVNVLGVVVRGSDGQAVGYDSTTPTGLAPKDYATSGALATVTADLAALTAEIHGAWATYTPTFSGAIGNATVAFRYKKVGQTVNVEGFVQFGSTSTYPATMTFTLPATAATAMVGGDVPLGVARCTDASASTRYGAHVLLASTTTVSLGRFGDEGAGVPLSVAAWGTTHPFTWTTGDYLGMAFTYEAA